MQGKQSFNTEELLSWYPGDEGISNEISLISSGYVTG